MLVQEFFRHIFGLISKSKILYLVFILPSISKLSLRLQNLELCSDLIEESLQSLGSKVIRNSLHEGLTIIKNVAESSYCNIQS